MKLTAHDGVELELRELGGSGPPVLFVHGLGLNGAVWEPVAAGAAVTAFALDLRGHGASAVPEEHPFAWEAFAADVTTAAAAIRERTGEPPRGAGHSGGAGALRLASDAFAALLLYEPPSPHGAPAERVEALVAAALRRRDWYPSLDAAEATLAQRPPLKAFHPDVRRAYVDAGFVPGPQGTVQLACRPRDEARIYALPFPLDAPAPGCPTVYLVGAESEPWRHVDGAERFAGAGHYGPLERPAAFAERLNRFVSPPG